MTRIAIAFIALFCIAADKGPYFGIQVVDADSGKGVPLVELRTTNDIAFVTDSGGWIAFHEPGLMGKEVYFAVSGPGYEYPKDGFGFRGVRLNAEAGKTATVKVQRINIAERMYRVTGEGIHRDGDLLGRPSPLPEANADVMGQDSVQCVPYRGKLFWLWGDTNLPNYPLGVFHTTAATSPLDAFQNGIPLTYFTDEENPRLPRRMAPLIEKGVVWLFGLLVVKGNDGEEVLISHYSRRKSLAEELEHGLVRFNDDEGYFRKLRQLPLEEKWRFPRGNAFQHGDHFYFASPLAHTRVPATLVGVTDPTAYESFAFDADKGEYVWQKVVPPTTQADERKLVRDGKMKAESARYTLSDVSMHTASMAWNAHRKRWVMVGVEQGGKDAPSYLGEVWYAEADAVTGPWRKAVKVATHPRYDFYNVRLHPHFDRDGGRFVHFEGTYTRTFSGNPVPTARYDYNQLMYRLDLADPRLAAAR